MNRKQFISKKEKEFNGKYIPKDRKLEYFERLIKPYQGKNIFILQYLDADGNELKDKFWNVRSSSRFAFELYSWLANEKDVTHFEFEKKLENIKNSPRKPNMDVYLEKQKKVIFIESKLTEKTPQHINNLSTSYYLGSKEDSERDLEQVLEHRYHGNKDFAHEFPEFI